MKVLELMTKCANCYYGETKVTICDGDGGRMHGVPATIPDYVKDMYVREFKLSKVDNGKLTALEIEIEGRDRV